MEAERQPIEIPSLRSGCRWVLGVMSCYGTLSPCLKYSRRSEDDDDDDERDNGEPSSHHSTGAAMWLQYNNQSLVPFE